MQPVMLKKVIISSDVLRHDQGVGLAGRLEDVAALVGDPVVLEVVPAALEHEAVDRLRDGGGGERMPALRTRSRLHHCPSGVEHQRPEPDVLRLRHPDALVVRQRWDDDLRRLRAGGEAGRASFSGRAFPGRDWVGSMVMSSSLGVQVIK